MRFSNPSVLRTIIYLVIIPDPNRSIPGTCCINWAVTSAQTAARLTSDFFNPVIAALNLLGFAGARNSSVSLVAGEL